MAEHAEMGPAQSNEHRTESCESIREILGHLGDKWTVAILRVLGSERMRFKELHRAVDGISQRMLSVTLRSLERDGLVVRTVYPSVPPRVEYEMSDLGRSFKSALAPIGEWVLANQPDIQQSRRRFDGRASSDDRAEAPTLTKS